MSPPGPGAHPSLEELLESQDWVYRLARSLVRDPHDAEDVAQSAWLRVFRGGPRDPGATRGWLRVVVRNLALQKQRNRERRIARERAASREHAERDASESLERVELHGELARAVAGLPDPYRETIAMRYFDGLRPSEVAVRQGVPARTVETRLRRGIELLRTELDRRNGGDREAWFGALAAIAAAGSEPTSKALVAVLSLLVLVPIVWLVMPDRDSPLTLNGAALVDTVPPPAERFGVSVFREVNYDPTRVGASWYFNWKARPYDGVDLEFVPMVGARRDATGLGADEIAALQDDARSGGHPPGTTWIVGGLIGYQEDRRPPETYARDFHACRTALLEVDPSFRFCTGPVHLTPDERLEWQVVGGSALGYLASVIEAYERLFGERFPADSFGANACVIANDGVDVGRLEANIRRFRAFLAERGFRDREVLLTSVGVPVGDPGYDAIGEFLGAATEFLATARDSRIGCSSDDDRLVQRWCWATAQSPGLVRRTLYFERDALVLDISQTALFNLDGELNFLGREYARSVERALGAGWVERTR